MQEQQVADLRLRELAVRDHAAGVLREHVAGFAQRPGDRDVDERPAGRQRAVVRVHGHRVIAAVHRRPHQVVEARIDQHEVVLRPAVHALHFGDERAGFRHEEAARFDLDAHRVAEMPFDPLARGIPLAEVVADVDARLAVAIRDRQPAARGDCFDVVAERRDEVDHRIAHLRQVAVVDARADVHVNADQLQPVLAHDLDRARHVVDPDSVLALRAAGVGLVAVAVAETRIHAQPDAMAGRVLADAREHVERAGIHGHAMLEHGRERRAVDQVGREHDAFRFARRAEPGREAAFDLAERHGIDARAFFAHQLQDMQVRVRLLRIADHVELAQLGDAVADDVGVVHPQRCAVLLRERRELAGIERHGG